MGCFMVKKGLVPFFYKDVSQKMIQKALLIHFKNSRIFSSLELYLIFLLLISFIWGIITVFVSIYLHDYFLSLIILLLLTQYNAPLFVNDLYSFGFNHYYYRRKVKLKYIYFLTLKHNPMIIFSIIYLVIYVNIRVINLDIMALFYVLNSIIVCVNLIIVRLVKKIIPKALFMLSCLATIFSLISLKPIIISLSIITNLIALVFILVNISPIRNQFKLRAQYNIRKSNMYYMVNWLYIIRMKKENTCLTFFF